MRNINVALCRHCLVQAQPYAGFAFHRHSLGQAEVQVVIQGWIDKGSQEKALPCAGTALCRLFILSIFAGVGDHSQILPEGSSPSP